MSFGSPGALWLLLLAVPVVALHLYRGRVRRLAVPALSLWEEVLVEEERESALSRLRHVASLAAVLLALALLAVSLAEPEVRGISPEPRRFALVVDTSPELEVLEADGRPRRLAALEAARDFLGRLGRRDSAALLDAAGILEPATTDAERRLRALERIPREGAALDPAELKRIAESAAPGAELWVIGSRPWPAGVNAIPAGSPRANAGLAAGGAQRRGTKVALALTAVQAGGPGEPRRLEIRSRGRVVEQRDLALAAGERRELQVEVEAGPGEALLEARLAPADAVPGDDAAAWVLPASEPFPVLVVAEGEPDPHLVSALRVFAEAGEFRLGIARGGRWREAWTPESVVVFDRVAPPRPLEDGGWLVLGGPGPTVPAPKVVSWDRNAPVQRWVDWTDLALKSSRILAEGTPLVTSDRGPIMAGEGGPGRAWIETGFGVGVGEGDAALRSSFPIFLRNALRWLAVEGRRGAPWRAAAGDVLRLAGGGTLRATEVDGGGGTTRELAAADGGWRIPLRRAGLLKLEAGGRTEWVAVSGPAPLDASAFPAASGALPPPPVPWRELPWAPAAAALAGLLLLAEWALHRRGLS